MGISLDRVDRSLLFGNGFEEHYCGLVLPEPDPMESRGVDHFVEDSRLQAPYNPFEGL